MDKFDKYPLITDSKDNVLSMPPIINGELTKLTEDTVNVLIDVTGTDERAVNFALNIIAVHLLNQVVISRPWTWFIKTEQLKHRI